MFAFTWSLGWQLVPDSAMLPKPEDEGARPKKREDNICSRKETLAFFGMYWLALWFSTPFAFMKGIRN